MIVWSISDFRRDQNLSENRYYVCGKPSYVCKIKTEQGTFKNTVVGGDRMPMFLGVHLSCYHWMILTSGWPFIAILSINLFASRTNAAWTRGICMAVWQFRQDKFRQPKGLKTLDLMFCDKPQGFGVSEAFSDIFHHDSRQCNSIQIPPSVVIRITKHQHW